MKVKQTKVNKVILVGDSWKLPRMKWTDAKVEGKKGDKIRLHITTDIGLRIRAKGDKTDGVVVVQPYLSHERPGILCEVGEEGKIQIKLAGAPDSPAPRTGVTVVQIMLITRAKKEKGELVPTIDEAKKVREAEKAIKEQLAKIEDKK